MKKETEHLKVQIDVTKLPNKLHFEIQKNTRMGIFRDKTKYTRKRKHKGKEESL